MSEQQLPFVPHSSSQVWSHLGFNSNQLSLIFSFLFLIFSCSPLSLSLSLSGICVGTHIPSKSFFFFFFSLSLPRFEWVSPVVWPSEWVSEWSELSGVVKKIPFCLETFLSVRRVVVWRRHDVIPFPLLLCFACWLFVFSLRASDEGCEYHNAMMALSCARVNMIFMMGWRKEEKWNDKKKKQKDKKERREATTTKPNRTTPPPPLTNKVLWRRGFQVGVEVEIEGRRGILYCILWFPFSLLVGFSGLRLTMRQNRERLSLLIIINLPYLA